MPNPTTRSVLLMHIAGFGALALLVWLNEILDIPHHLFGAESTVLRAEEALLESALIVLLGTVVVLLIRRLSRRIAYLQSFIVLCGWCRRVQLDEEWLSMENYLQRHDTQASHGICPDCERKVSAEMRAAISPGGA